ncbi:hypothetical protein SFRURICE_007476 [Spodoptera frugiperda]|nr:hypothetical protein SFRURICE_007476 [Spodoptera frugiperda]
MITNTYKKEIGTDIKLLVTSKRIGALREEQKEKYHIYFQKRRLVYLSDIQRHSLSNEPDDQDRSLINIIVN